MKTLPGVLYAVFTTILLAVQAVLLAAQTSAPDRPADRVSALGTRSADQLGSLQRRFRPEIILPAEPQPRFCVSPDLDRKSLSVKRCDSKAGGLRLVAPFEGPARQTKPAK